MIEGSKVEVQMIKAIKKGIILDKNVYTCIVESYENQEEKFEIKVQDSQVLKLLLDARYRCKIYTDKKILACEGMFKERYQCENGSIAIFYVESGFYQVFTD